jgi:hypothetical protein
MSKQPFSHMHRDTEPGTVVVHSPDGAVNGYIRRVRVRGQSRPGFVPLDENRKALIDSYVDTRDRAWEWVNER